MRWCTIWLLLVGHHAATAANDALAVLHSLSNAAGQRRDAAWVPSNADTPCSWAGVSCCRNGAAFGLPGRLVASVEWGNSSLLVGCTGLESIVAVDLPYASLEGNLDLLDLPPLPLVFLGLSHNPGRSPIMSHPIAPCHNHVQA